MARSENGCLCHALICFTCPCACLHLAPGVAHLPHLSPGYLYVCSLFVCCQFVLFVQPAFSQLLFLPSLSFLILLVLNLAWPNSEPTCFLPSCTFATPLDYRPLPALTCRLPAINIVTSTQSALWSYLKPDT